MRNPYVQLAAMMAVLGVLVALIVHQVQEMDPLTRLMFFLPLIASASVGLMVGVIVYVIRRLS
jgi:ABC-type sugar transport system permease subunit